jgi:hypothetical protein
MAAEVEYLFFAFIAYDRIGRQPLAADQKQQIEGLANRGVGLKLFDNQSEPSAISIRNRSVIAADSIAQTIDHGTKEQ